MYGSTLPFLLIFESQVERHLFLVLRHLMTTCIPRVDGLSMNPEVWDVHKYDGFVLCQCWI